MTAKERVGALRRLMRREGLDAYLVPSTDPHMSEYVPACWRRRAWISGFSGSAGDVLVTHRAAGLWTDSRYFLQAEKELDPAVFKLFKLNTPGFPTLDDYLAHTLRRRQVLGVDPHLLSKGRAEQLEAKLGPQEIGIKYLARNLVDEIWRDRPALPCTPILRHPDRFAGETAKSKLERVRGELRRTGAEAHVLTMLDAIAWLFNIRGADVDYNPVTIAYAVVTLKDATLFIDEDKVPARLRPWLAEFVRLRPYAQIGPALKALAHKGTRVLLDPDAVDRWVLDQLKGGRLLFEPSPVTRFKAAKNPAQLRTWRQAMVEDGVAMVRFLHWFERGGRPARLTESQAAERLAAFRSQGHNYMGPGFAPIVSWAGNGAIVHYSPTPGADAVIGKRGLLLLDTGGQYLGGTTDITRTIAVGEPTERERRFFTRVLQGHIRLAQVIFPSEMSGGRLELLARLPLWEEREDYGHGTGHGVGQFLNVHEGPVGFSVKGMAKLEEGNVISLEPGHYEAGRFGVRTENLVAVVPERKRYRPGERVWFKLETLTLCPIDLRLVEAGLMEPSEIAWLNAYHERVRAALSPRLEPEIQSWLAEVTRSISR